MEETIEIRWHGRGGQGVVTASELLSEAALLEGKFFQALPEFGAERSGAPIRAYTRISPLPIEIHYAVSEPDVVVVLDPTLLGTSDLTLGLRANGLILVNTSASPKSIRDKLQAFSARVHTIDASGIAQRTIGRNIPNIPMLGALLAVLPLVDSQSLRLAIERRLGARMSRSVVEGNLRALEEASQAVRSETGSGNGAAPVTGAPAPQIAGAAVQGMWKELVPGGVILAAGNSVEYETGSWRSERPVIDWSRCTHCLLCWVYCPDSCFEVSQQRLKSVDYGYCKGCGICAVQCPPKCIDMVAELALQEG